MTEVIKHRGPDGEGFFVNGNIGLGHRRLSIIDLETGDQPMYSDDGSIVIIFNGEIYNYIELKAELQKLGIKFKTASDTEIIIKAYEKWGVDCQKKFNGMWAFALWDSKKQQLLLSRDRIGEKPLNYSVKDNTLVFSSEIKSLFLYGIPRQIRTELIEIYLVMTNIPGPHTFYKDIFKLNPGYFILANSYGIKEYKYWDLPEIDEGNLFKNKKKVYEEFKYLLEDSIRLRMRSDVPYGAFLSGGLDSSSIVALMSGISNHPIETFTIGFSQRDFDESSLALLVADKFHTNHHNGTVNPASLEEAIKRSVFYFDEPFGDSSAIPTFQVSQFARHNVKMVLTGDGGDEVLSGYNSYAGIKFSQLYSQLPRMIGRNLPKGVDLISNLLSGGMRYKLNHVSNVLKTAYYPFSERIVNKAAYISLPVIKRLTLEIKNVIPVEDYLSDRIKGIPYKDEFYQLMYLDFKHHLPDDYLVKVDRMSMANSIETRAPFLDFRLIEFMVGVDKKVKMQGWERKSVLRNTVGKLLPEKLLKAPKKGFGIPLRDWFKKEHDPNILSLNNIKSFMDPKMIKEIIDNNRLGFYDSGNFLWTLIVLDSFMSSK
jgi:asparagine synthase (glutamine-hydrolysing)